MKFMKFTMLLVLALLVGQTSYAAVSVRVGDHLNLEVDYQSMDQKVKDLNVDAFLDLTPKKFRKLTGKKLGIKNAIKLKAAQKFIKKKLKKDADISSGVYVLLAILGLGWLAMGLLSDWSGNDWLVNLILTVLCWLPGLIHALIKKKDYY